MKRLFKFLLLFSVFAGFSSEAFSQVLTRPVKGSPPVVVIKDSAVNSGTKYLNFLSTPNGVVGLSLTGIKPASGGGTISGYAIVQVRTDTMPTQATSSWIDYVYPGTTKRDTLFFTDLTTAQGHQWPVPVQFFNGARFKVVTSGTQKLYLYPSTLRR